MNRLWVLILLVMATLVWGCSKDDAMEANSSGNVSSDADTDADSDADADADSDADSDSDSDADSDSDTDADSDSDTDADSDSDTDADSDSDSDSDTDADSDSDTDADSDSDADSDTDSDADSDTDSDSDTDTETDTDSDTEEPKIPLVCPDGEDHPETCYCLRIGVIGIFDSAANDEDKDVSLFVDWLNNDSSATVTMINETVSDKPTIDADFLADYDLLLFLLQTSELNTGQWWSYSADEAEALKTWIEAGGGVITVTGFDTASIYNEVNAINSILQPATGIAYEQEVILSSCPSGLNCFCWSNAIPIDGFDPEHPISKEINWIGAFIGYSIAAPDDAQIVASNDEGNTIVAKEMGEGRVVAIADEWPLFSKFWMAEMPDEELNFEKDTDESRWPEHTCYDTENEYWKTPYNVFQIPQFWYNVIDWSGPENECFHIDHPLIILE
ncbi:MAG: hypothetical protein JXX14_14800 [Deltaproteobacteria bacterium]|nr:hypothetical protein [Deltaproteobacteria bacterium]